MLNQLQLVLDLIFKKTSGSLYDRADYSGINTTKSILLELEYQHYLKTNTEIHDLIIQHDKNNIIALQDAFIHYLRLHWDLISRTSLCYFANPDSAATELLIDIAEWVSLGRHGHSRMAVYYLMPSVAVDHIINSALDLTNIPMSLLLRSYILAPSKKYLVPLAILCEIEISDMDQELSQINNRYYQHPDCVDLVSYQHGLSDVKLPLSIWEDLYEHSPDAMSLMHLRDEWKALQSNNVSLLSQLRCLYHVMDSNSADGVGAEQDIGRAGSIGLVAFFKFYLSLSKLAINKIPSNLKKELDLIIELATPQYETDEATGKQVLTNDPADRRSCFNERKIELKKLINEHQVVLSSITLNESDLSKQLKQVKGVYDEARDHLKVQIISQKYAGSSRKKISNGILEYYQVQLIPTDFHSFSVLESLNDEELTAICTPTVMTALIDMIKRIDDIILLSFEVKPSVFNYLIKRLGPDILSKLKKISPHQIASLINILSESYSEALNRLIFMDVNKLNDFYYRLLMAVYSEKQESLIKQIGIAKLVLCFSSISQIISYLSMLDRSTMIQLIAHHEFNNHLKSIQIHPHDDVNFVNQIFNKLGSEGDREFFVFLNYHADIFLKHSDSELYFDKVRSIFLQHLKSIHHDFNIKISLSFILYAFKHLSENDRNTILDELKRHPDYFYTSNVHYIGFFISQISLDMIFELRSFITYHIDQLNCKAAQYAFIFLLIRSDVSKQRLIYRICENKLFSNSFDHEDFKQICYSLAPKMLLQFLSKVIGAVSPENNLLSCITLILSGAHENIFSQVLDKINSRFPGIFKTLDDYLNAFDQLKDGRSAIFYQCHEMNMLSFINTDDALIRCMDHLTADSQLLLITSITKRPQFNISIMRSHFLLNLMQVAKISVRERFYQRLDFEYILSHFTKEELNRFYFLIRESAVSDHFTQLLAVRASLMAGTKTASGLFSLVQLESNVSAAPTSIPRATACFGLGGLIAKGIHFFKPPSDQLTIRDQSAIANIHQICIENKKYLKPN